MKPFLSTPEKQIPAIIFAIVFVCCAWIFMIGEWNHIARYDAVMSFVEPGTPDFLSFRIDRFITSQDANTVDWSKSPDGHYYSNKAPGQILGAVCVYAPLYFLEHSICGLETSPALDLFNTYMMNLFTSVLFAALGAVFMFKLLLLLGFSTRRAAVWALIYGLATPLLPYSAAMWGHVVAASCLMFAIYCFALGGGRGVLWCGFWCGMAFLNDYLAVLVLFIFPVMLFVREKRSIWLYILGGLPVALVYFAYHWWCFGNPFLPATVYNNPVFLESGKTIGVFSPANIVVTLKLLISRYRGMFYYSPVLLAAIPGFFALKREKKNLAWGLLAISASSVLVLSGFNGWHGGATAAPRYLIPFIPAFTVLAAAWLPASKIWRSSIAALGIVSFCNMLVMTYCSVSVWQILFDPLKALYINFFSLPDIPKLFNYLRAYRSSGDAIANAAMQYYSFSIGNLLGLRGLYSVALMLAISGSLLFVLSRVTGGFNLKNTLFAEGVFDIRKYEISPSKLFFAAACLLYIIYPGYIPFMKDEAALLSEALKMNDAGTMGPSYLWAYQIILMIVYDPVAAVLLKNIIFVFFAAWAVFRLARIFNIEKYFSAALCLAFPPIWFSVREISTAWLIVLLTLWLSVFIAEYRKTHSCGKLVLSMLFIALLPLAVPSVYTLFTSCMKAPEFSWFDRAYSLLNPSGASGILFCLVLLAVAVMMLSAGVSMMRGKDSAAFGKMIASCIVLSLLLCVSLLAYMNICGGNRDERFGALLSNQWENAETIMDLNRRGIFCNLDNKIENDKKHPEIMKTLYSLAALKTSHIIPPVRRQGTLALSAVYTSSDPRYGWTAIIIKTP